MRTEVGYQCTLFDSIDYEVGLWRLGKRRFTSWFSTGFNWCQFFLNLFLLLSQQSVCEKTRACNKNAKSFLENLRRNLNVPMPIAWRFSKVLINGRRQVPNRDHRVDNGEIDWLSLLHWDPRTVSIILLHHQQKINVHLFIASPVLTCWLLLHPLFPSLRAKSELHQDEERSKVIDDVLVILQTLLKRTDTLQTLAIPEYFGGIFSDQWN